MNWSTGQKCGWVFFSGVLGDECYDISPLIGKRLLPAASTERWVGEELTDELVEYFD